MPKDNIQERVDGANRRVAEMRGEWNVSCKESIPSDYYDGWICESCGLVGNWEDASLENHMKPNKDYASGPSEFLTLLDEIRAEALKQLGSVSIVFDFEDIVYVDIHGRDGQPDQPLKMLVSVTAPTLPLAVTEAWNEVFGKCKACKGSGLMEVSGPDKLTGCITIEIGDDCPKCKGTGQGLKGGKDNG